MKFKKTANARVCVGGSVSVWVCVYKPIHAYQLVDVCTVYCMCTQRYSKNLRVCITLFWLNYDFLIRSSISVCVCGADLAGKAACCLWTIRKSSAYQQNWAQLQIPENTDRQEQMLGMKRERFPTFWTCLHLALRWVRLLKCGSFNCVNMQPTQKLQLELQSCRAFQTFLSLA